MTSKIRARLSSYGIVLFIVTPTTLWAGEESEDETSEWRVEELRGPTNTISIDTETGTWMSVDVSPDGDKILFDLLGDIYQLPVGGGVATPVTSGPAWDMQPSYSPDGTKIAFTSDRGGGDNIWTLTLSENEPSALTTEKLRLLNSPRWSPDGTMIAARKHFTSDRSLGAGEIWLYDLDGGSGWAATHRKNEQKDLGEPAFSPSGKEIYYSFDATAGDHFEYDKDSNTGIYAIDTIDLATGKTKRIAGGPGGAVRPTPSPDGNAIAFVRRVRHVTILVYKELASGKERVLAQNLSRDNQETWAIHGVYPAFDFTPDGHSIIYWAQGQLYRVAVDGSDPVEIPFKVQAKKMVSKAIRYPVEVAPDEVTLKMLRGVTVSPSEQQVMYETLGNLYLYDIAKERPQRLTSNDQVELSGAFSRDGKQITYTTWSDTEFGAVWVAKSNGKRQRAITEERGHYIEPNFSPSGDLVVYRKIGGDDLRGTLWSRDQGIYLTNLKTGATTHLARRGEKPHFGADDSRVFFQVNQSASGLTLMSVSTTPSSLEGNSETTHASSAMATDYTVSPNGKKLAIQEDHKLYLAPMPPIVGAHSVGPSADSGPLQEISVQAGNTPWFSVSGDKIHWSLGPELFSASTSLTTKEVTRDSIILKHTTSYAKPTGTVAIIGAKIITMNGDEVFENGTVVWDGDRITAVGDQTEVSVPEYAQRIDGHSLTVIPGLIDVHAHGSYGSSGIIPSQSWRALSYLSFGVTTIHDPSNDTDTIFAASERAKAGVLLSPRIFSTGRILYGAEAPGLTAKIDTLDDALFHLSRMKAVGAFSVKSYNQPRREQRQMVLAAARELEMMVVPEGGALLMQNLTQVVDGHTGVEHALPAGDLHDDVIQLWAGTQVGYTPTLGVAYGGLGGENYWYAHTDVWANERLSAFVPPWRLDPISRRHEKAPLEEYNHIAIAAAAHKLAKSGVKVNVGAHGQREGLAVHWEMWMLAQGGFTPLEAIQTGTINGAKYLGLDKDIGSIEVGKLADMAVLRSDPSIDLTSSEDVTLTILGGTVYKSNDMSTLYPTQEDRAPLSWEGERAVPTFTQPGQHSCTCER